jgi:hypothetical protein
MTLKSASLTKRSDGVRSSRAILNHRPRLHVLGSAVTVTSTCAPFLNFTSSPFSSINAFSMRRSLCGRWAPSTAICAFSAELGRGGAMILSTVAGIVTLGRSGIRARSSLCSAILADRLMRGREISLIIRARAPAAVDLGFFGLCRMPFMVACRRNSYSPVWHTCEDWPATSAQARRIARRCGRRNGTPAIIRSRAIYRSSRAAGKPLQRGAFAAATGRKRRKTCRRKKSSQY